MIRHRVILLFTLLAVLAGIWNSAQAGTVTLFWTAPGDDGNLGIATKYEIRYSFQPITAATWDVAAVAGWVPIPVPAGARQSAVVSGLQEGQRYYFAIKAKDDLGNWSGISNVVSAVVQPDVCVGSTGNVNCDANDRVNLTDLTTLVDHLFATYRPLACPQEANVNGDSRGEVNLNDVTYLVLYLYRGGPPPAPCH